MIILESALQEFAQKGYELASTNAIIQAAGVSKGLLFHYFGSKKQLFLETLDMCVHHFVARFDELMKCLPGDIFERIIQVNRLKLVLAAEQPLMHELLSVAFLDVPQDLKADIMQRQQKIQEQYLPLFFLHVDQSPFRKEIDPHKAIELVLMVASALGDRYIKAYQAEENPKKVDMEGYVTELAHYLEMVKHGIYKN